ncbi:DHA2 family efflux MFS transporter permease subunit [Tengunoibacter tsumagoiensis]|uniref:Putative MFS-type transporter YhcA n=1 Tax=Tengunoibacter tsumagoiensis TaxID=2014871 RepID=A0A401ZWC8_9CHLR|nr:DHA2 family efflux MFS transporter permease subunit [Tengunoibacter tsumagoiensis]GCE11183.1 putative MFS-type transporter YhcA [Tengunoibacter tsumagoiensis]
MQIPAPATRQREGVSYKWIVAIVVVFGLFMTVLDGTIVNVAIPRLQNAFGADLNSVQWVLTGYTLAQGVATPLTAFLANRFGNKRFYLLALAGFTLGSALCGLAWNLQILIIFRILQGLTGAFLSPLSITMLYQEFPPEERGTAMGFLGIPILLAPAFGPTLGGYIVTFASWPLIFFINVPIGIAGVLMGFFFLRNNHDEARVNFDLPGFLLSSSGLALLLYGLSSASSDGWGSSTVMGCMISGIILLAIFIAVELMIAKQGKQPLLDLRVFATRSFTTSNIASVLVTFAMYGGLFLVPVYLQNLRGLSAYQSGLLLLPQAFASMVAVLIGGRLVDKLGVRAVVIPGLALLGLTLWLLTSVNLSTPYNYFQILLVIRGFAIGLCMQPLTVSSLGDIKPRMLSQASSVNTTLRFVMSSLAVSIIATLVQSQTKQHYGHLAEQVTPASSFGHLAMGMQQLLISRGLSPVAATAGAMKMIAGKLQVQSYMLAIQDAFWLSVILTVVAILAAFFVGSGKKSSKEPMSAHEQEEAAKAREEALLGG